MVATFAVRNALLVRHIIYQAEFTAEIGFISSAQIATNIFVGAGYAVTALAERHGAGGVIFAFRESAIAAGCRFIIKAPFSGKSGPEMQTFFGAAKRRLRIVHDSVNAEVAVFPAADKTVSAY